MSARRVAVGGLPYFGRMLSEYLSGSGWKFRYVESTARDPRAWAASAATIARADGIYLVGGQLERGSRPDWLARFVRKPIVMHWVGSDVTYALNAARTGRLSPRLIDGPVHWAEVEWTAAELQPLGIKPAIVPLTPTQLPETAAPFPATFTVLAYLPPARTEFYGRSTIYRLAAQLPDVRFSVAGNSGPDSDAPPNVVFLGWVPAMHSVYAGCSVLLRLAEHDGLSFMVLEALAAGRYVIWNHPLPGVTEVHGEEEALAALRGLCAQHAQGALFPNETGLATIRARYAPGCVRNELIARLAAILDGRRSGA